jgi:hypothetical protein
MNCWPPKLKAGPRCVGRVHPNRSVLSDVASDQLEPQFGQAVLDREALCPNLANALSSPNND